MSSLSQREQLIVDTLRDALRGRQKKGNGVYIRGGSGLLEYVEKFYGKKGLVVDYDDLGMAFNVLRGNKEVEARDWSLEVPNHPLRGRVKLNLPALPKSDHECWWEEALNDSNLPREALKALSKGSVVKNLQGLSRDDMDALVRGLQELRQAEKREVSEFVGSARHLLASSKLLGSFGKAVKDGLVAQGDRFRSVPRYVIVAGPPEPSCVLLIENPQSLEMAVEAGVDKTVCLVSVYGYGLASASVRKNVEAFWKESFEGESSLVRLVRSGSPPDLGQVFGAEKVFWWGDLDLAGVDIFLRLKDRIPNLELSALYEPMVQILREGGGHPYVKCVEKEEQPGRYAARQWPEHVEALVAVCAERAVDQEAVQPNQIVDLCGKGLKEINGY